METYPMLFSPMKIGSAEIRNRVIMTGMGTGMGTTERTYSDQMIAFYTERARGGVGLIIPETSMVNEVHGFGAPCQISYANDRIIPSLQKLMDSVHRYGAKLFVQLYHPGREMNPSFAGGMQPVSASDVTSAASGITPRPLETEEVYSLIQDFVDAAWRVQRGGGDGVELHAGHGYLLNQFLSPYTNHRSDEFGGDRDGRAKIVRDIIAGIRCRCGSDFPVMVRVSVDEFIGDKGIELEEGVEICRLLEAAGADAIDVTCGIYDSMNRIMEPFSFREGWRVYMTEAVKKAVNIPVSGNGKIRHPEFAEQLLEEGKQDFIGMARTHLADPEWCNKARTGRADQIRFCISCMRCSESRSECAGSGQPIGCSVNPQTGRELRYPIFKADGAGKTAVVVGAGPSGMEAARVLANRRFHTILLEQNDELGGQLRYARKGNFKERIQWLIDYYKHQFELLGVDVRRNTPATAEMIKALDPYAVIIATGGAPSVPGFIPGVHGDNVYLTTDVIGEKVHFSGKNVVIVGSGITGLEVAEMLGEDNHVDVVEMAPKLTPDGWWQIVTDMMSRLTKMDISFYPSHKLLEITPEGVKLEGEHTELKADAVVLAMGIRSVNGLYKELKDALPKVYCTGDASTPGKIYMATSSGFFAANRV